MDCIIMAIGYCDESRITDIADAIKEKSGDSSSMTLKDMPSRIRSISGGGNTKLRAYRTSGVSRPVLSYYIQDLYAPNWDTSGVTDLSYAFQNATWIKTMNLSGWDTSNVTTMVSIFDGCTNLTTLDLSGWNTKGIGTATSERMFTDCTSLANLTLGENWGESSSYMYFYLSSCPLTHDSCLDVFNKLADKSSSGDYPYIYIKSSVKSEMSSSEIAIATSKGWTVSAS